MQIGERVTAREEIATRRQYGAESDGRLEPDQHMQHPSNGTQGLS